MWWTRLLCRIHENISSWRVWIKVRRAPDIAFCVWLKILDNNEEQQLAQNQGHFGEGSFHMDIKNNISVSWTAPHYNAILKRHTLVSSLNIQWSKTRIKGFFSVWNTLTSTSFNPSGGDGNVGNSEQDSDPRPLKCLALRTFGKWANC